MNTKDYSRKIRLFSVLALMGLMVFFTTDVFAFRGGGRGGGSSFSRSAGGFSSGGVASSGRFNSGASSRLSHSSSFEGSRLSDHQAGHDRSSFQSTRQDERTSRQDANREDRQSYGESQQQNRQAYGQSQQEKRQEYASDYDHYHGGGAYRAGAATAAVIGSTLTYDEFNNLGVHCGTVGIDGQTYYQCGSVWYQETPQGYVVVNEPW